VIALFIAAAIVLLVVGIEVGVRHDEPSYTATRKQRRAWAKERRL
jgi:hypothetical protein